MQGVANGLTNLESLGKLSRMVVKAPQYGEYLSRAIADRAKVLHKQDVAKLDGRLDSVLAIQLEEPKTPQPSRHG
jgi:hypothetical protein